MTKIKEKKKSKKKPPSKNWMKQNEERRTKRMPTPYEPIESKEKNTRRRSGRPT